MKTDHIQASLFTSASDDELQEKNLLKDFDLESFDCSFDLGFKNIDTDTNTTNIDSQSDISSLSFPNQKNRIMKGPTKQDINLFKRMLLSQHFDKNNNIITIFSDGSKVIKNQRGACVAWSPDGIQTIKFPGCDEVQIIRQLSSTQTEYTYYNQVTEVSRIVIFENMQTKSINHLANQQPNIPAEKRSQTLKRKHAMNLRNDTNNQHKKK